MRKLLHSIGLAIALAALAPGHAFADCEGSNRISHSDASCLTAEWTNDVKDGRPRLFYQNKCQWYGTMGTLTVFENDLTETMNVRKSISKLGVHSSNVDNVYCCKDRQGQFCNRADKLTDSFCSGQFSASPASKGGCVTTSATADTEDEECTITADCPGEDGETVSSTLSVDMAATSSIQECNDNTLASSC